MEANMSGKVPIHDPNYDPQHYYNLLRECSGKAASRFDNEKTGNAVCGPLLNLVQFKEWEERSQYVPKDEKNLKKQ
jgi:hypothetical protein